MSIFKVNSVPALVRNTRPTRCAFTLIELLVVISIIALLIAILLPALSKARKASHASVSLSNLRQLTISQLNYAHDQKDSMMYYRFNKNGVTDRPYWGGWLFRRGYITTTNVFWSPARDTSVLDFSIGLDVSNNWAIYTGYGMNRGLTCTAKENEEDDEHPLKLYEFNAPSPGQFLVLAEVWGMDTSVSLTMQRAGLSWSESYRDAVNLYTYSGGAPRSYLDGHANMTGSSELYWFAQNTTVGNWIGNSTSSARKKGPWYKGWRN